MLVDCHAHLHFKEFASDINQVMQRCKDRVAYILDSGTDHEGNLASLDLAKTFSIILPSLGIYPTYALNITEQQLDDEIDFIIKNKDKMAAVGEIGLDYKETTDLELQKKQRDAFRKILDAVEKIKKPVVLHSRKAERDVIEIMESTKIKKIVFHCFTGKYSLVKRVADNGWSFSIPPIITKTLHFQGMMDLVNTSQILTETDAPYLSPELGVKNEPIFIEKTIQKIAELKKCEPRMIEEEIFSNFKKIFLK